jgi:hypothetical protein
MKIIKKFFLWIAGFSFSPEATDVPTKTINFAKGQGKCFNIQAENTKDFHSF